MPVVPFIPAIIGAVGAIGGGIASGNAESKAKARDQQLQREINSRNYQIWLEGRGLGGYSKFPIYASKGAETEAWNSAMNTYKATRGGEPAKEIAKYTNMVAPMQSALGDAQTQVSDILSGQEERNRLRDYESVANARNRLAATQREGANLAMNQALSRAKASEAMKGYTGSGSFAQNQLYKTSVPFMQAATGAEASAGLANAQQRFNIPAQERSLRLSTAAMAPELARQSITLDQMPKLATTAQQQNAFSVLSPFLQNPNQFKMGDMPNTSGVSPLGTGLSLAGASAGQIGGQVQQQKNLDRFLDIYAGQNSGTTPQQKYADFYYDGKMPSALQVPSSTYE